MYVRIIKQRKREYLTRVIVGAGSGHAENVFHPRFIKRNSECIERETRDGLWSTGENMCHDGSDSLHIPCSFWPIEENSSELSCLNSN